MNSQPALLMLPTESSQSSTSDFPAADEPRPAPVRPVRGWIYLPGWCLGRAWDAFSLCVLLAVVAAVPVVQLASLGYLLNSAAVLAAGRGWSRAFPGARLAGRLGTFVLFASVLWLPVWLLADLSYSAQLLLPASPTAGNWRLVALVATAGWIAWVFWAALRGGRIRHFLWPAPLAFFRRIFLVSTWRRASDQLYGFLSRLHFYRLWWLGARAAGGGLLWIAVPVSLMIIGQRSDDFRPAALVGLVGAVSMTVLMMYLPFLQVQMALDNRFASLFGILNVRKAFLFAPWAHALSLLSLCLLSLPLYLLRIEATPAELAWAPSLVFVLFMLPAKLLLGAAMGYARSRQHRAGARPRHWVSRWSARTLALASALVYVGALYVAQLIAGQGAFVMYFQHALLVPAPLMSAPS